jgi:hypothetical protein
MVTARYLSRRIGRSQNGMGGCFPGPFPFPLAVPPLAVPPLAVPPLAVPPPPAGSAGGAGDGVGLGAIADRCRGPAPDQPVDGQAGAGAAG